MRPKSLVHANTALFALSVVMQASLARAANTLTVPGQYPTIPAAVAAAAPGDTVVVADGTYPGSTNGGILVNKSITIRSEHGAAKTSIDLGGHYFLAANVGITLQGFTIKNGSSGSAAVRLNASATVVECAFVANSNTELGGAAVDVVGGATLTVDSCSFSDNLGMGTIYLGGASLIVTKSTFTNNAGNFSAGGAIYSNTGTVTISGSTFTGNRGTNANGGAVVKLNGALTVTDSAFVNNSTQAAGGALFVSAQGIDTPAVVSRTKFVGNSSRDGGVLFVAGSSGTTSSSFIDCVFLGNVASGDGAVSFGYGEGQPQSVSVFNSSFHGNKATVAGGGTLAGGPLTTLAVTNSILFGDLGANEISTARPFKSQKVQFTDIAQAGFVGKDGNLNVDPGYADAAQGDLGIWTTSPCAGTGRNEGAPATDFTNAPWGEKVSMGAYAPVEQVTHFAVSAPASAVVGDQFSFDVSALGAAQQPVSSYAKTVHFTSNSSSAALPSDATLVDGKGPFVARINEPGTFTITVTSTTSPTITGTSNPIAVSATNAEDAGADASANDPVADAGQVVSEPAEDAGGCGCRTAGRSDGDGDAAALCGLGVLLLVASRQRRRSA